jgi:hypothetical protein
MASVMGVLYKPTSQAITVPERESTASTIV